MKPAIYSETFGPICQWVKNIAKPVRASQMAGILLAIFLLGAPMRAFSNTTNTGIDFIGFANATNSAVENVSAAFLAAGGDLELSFLPFNYNPGRPFSNATEFVEMTLPSLKGSLTMTVYLGYHRDEPLIPDNGFQWGNFQTEASTLASGLQYMKTIGWQSRLDKLDAWVAYIRAWALQNAVAGKLYIVVVPMLEDNCPDKTEYSNFLEFIKAYQKSQGVVVDYRRSCESNVYRVGIPLELHDPSWASAAGITNGDLFANDGYGTDFITVAQFISLQQAAHKEGISTLWWTAEWNGYPKYGTTSSLPSRTNLEPFAVSGIYTDLVDVLKHR